MQHTKLQIPFEPDIEPSIEACRLDALDGLDFLDSPREESFDRLVNLIRKMFNVPMALVSAMDAHRQWLKAEQGLDITEAPRKDTLCRYVIADPKLLVVPDLSLDPRFAANPFVAGPPFLRFYAGAPLLTPEGHAVGTICALDVKPRQFTATQAEILGDIAFLTTHAIQLREFASTDLLTGLMSRRAFRDAGAKAMQLATRRGQPLSCVTFDIDHFKSVNDTYGHSAGDAVLAGVAGACRDIVQASDLFGRLGGEEFALILPQTDSRAAVTVAERLRGEIERQVFNLGGDQRRLTASFGIAAVDPATRDLDTLLSNADSALYKAKANGRNCTVSWEPQGEQTVSASRRRVLKGGRILFNGRTSTVDCTIRSLGANGAGLDVSSIVGIPDYFQLLIPADKFETRCLIAETSERHLDVEFC